MINRALLQAAVVGLALTGCTGGGGGGGFSGLGQVVVNMDSDPGDIAGATAVADRECANRGGRARFILLQPTSTGNATGGFSYRPPAAVFACDPAAPAAPVRRS